MGRRNNRTCIICNKEYHYCPTCGEDYSKPSWYAIFDGERCHDIYDICVDYRDKKISAEEAYEKISKYDISDIDNFVPVTKNQIKEILELHNKAESKNKKTTNNTKTNKEK